MEGKQLKDYIEWTKVKIRLETKGRLIFPNVREVWWASLGINIGHEIDGKNEKFERPVLILKKYSNSTALVLPITSQVVTGAWYHYSVYFLGQTSSIILDQARVVSNKRMLRKMVTLDEKLFEGIKNVLLKTL